MVRLPPRSTLRPDVESNKREGCRSGVLGGVIRACGRPRTDYGIHHGLLIPASTKALDRTHQHLDLVGVELPADVAVGVDAHGHGLAIHRHLEQRAAVDRPVRAPPRLREAQSGNAASVGRPLERLLRSTNASEPSASPSVIGTRKVALSTSVYIARRIAWSQPLATLRIAAISAGFSGCSVSSSISSARIGSSTP